MPPGSSGGSVVLGGVTYALVRILGEGASHRTLLLKDATGHLVARVMRPAQGVTFAGRLPMLDRITVPVPAGIVATIASNDSPPEPHVLRRFVDGLRIDELGDRFVHSGRSPAETATFVRRLCAPIQALHERDVVHGRLHPGNVFIGAGESPLITDAVVAMPAPGSNDASANPRAVLYAAPEVRAGGEASPLSDQWSLALLATCVLTGAAGGGATRRLAEDPSVTCAQQLGLPAGTAAVLARALSTDPASRFASVDGFSDALCNAILTPQHAATPSPSSKALKPQRGVSGYVVLAAIGGLLLGRLTLPSRGPMPDPASTVSDATPIAAQRPTPSPRRTSEPTPRPSATPGPTPSVTPSNPIPPLQRGLRSRWFVYDPARVEVGADPWAAEFHRTDAPIPAIDFEFGNTAPFNLPADFFACSFEAYLYVPTPGRYRFIASANGGCSFSIGAEVFGDSSLAGERQLTTELMLDEGLLPFTLQYKESSGNARLKLEWVRPDGTRETIPPSAFLSPPTNTPARLDSAWEDMWTRIGEAQRDRIRKARPETMHGLVAERDGVETFPAPLLTISLPFQADFTKLRGTLPEPWRIVRRDSRRIDTSGVSHALTMSLVPDEAAGPRSDLSNLVGIRLDEDKRRFTARVKLRFPNVTPNQPTQQVGLLLAENWHGMPDQNNFVRVAYGFTERAVVMRMIERDGITTDARAAGVVELGSGWFWLGVQRHGENYGAFLSTDGITWVNVMEFIAPHAIEHVGIYATRSGPGASLPVEVESFAISAELEIKPDMTRR